MAGEGALFIADDLPEIPNSWQWGRLGDLVDQSRGICYGIVQPGDHDTNGIPMVNSQNVLDGSVSPHIEFRVSKELHARFKRSTIRGGEILLTLVGANFGRVAIAPPAFAGFNCARPVGVIPVREHPKFVMFCLQSPLTRQFMDNWANTTAQPTLNLKEVANLPIPLPPLAEQKAIAAVLGALDDKIELNRRMNATLEAMARALFQSWFVDFDPVRAKLDGRPPAALDPATAALFPASFQDSPLGHIPKGWEIGTLGSILDVLETGRRPKGGVGSYTSGVPSVGAESINGIGVFDYSKTKYIPFEFFEKTSSGRVAHFDVLLYKDGGKPGEFRPRVGLFGHDFPFKTFCINEHVFRMRSVRTGQSFLFFTTSHQRVLDDFANKGGKAAIPGINQPDVKSTPIVLPPKGITDAFNARADLLCDQILHNAIQSRTLATLRDTLLPKLLSGELSLPAALLAAQAGVAGLESQPEAVT